MKIKFAYWLAVSLASLGLGIGCKRGSAPEAVAPLVGAFESRAAEKPGPLAKLPAGGSEADALRNRELAALAVAAFKSNDMVTVGSSLQRLRSTRDMTDDQRMAVQDAMINFQKTMAERADRGDTAAQEALDYLRGGHLRR
jgi:hypothetical protein